MKKFIVQVFVLSTSLILAEPAAADFVAYNDTGGTGTLETSPSSSGAHVTNFSDLLGGTSTGELVDYSTGMGTGVFASLAAVNLVAAAGAMPDSGTDANGIFDGFINMDDSASFDTAGLGWSYEVIFTGLDPTKTYTFVTTANFDDDTFEGDGATSRWTQFSIMGADTFSNESSDGVTEVSADVLQMNTGYNTELGSVIRWEGITAADGTFAVLSENVGVLGGPGDPFNSFGFQGFQLVEIPAPGAIILALAGICGLPLFSRRSPPSFRTG